MIFFAFIHLTLFYPFSLFHSLTLSLTLSLSFFVGGGNGVGLVSCDENREENERSGIFCDKTGIGVRRPRIIWERGGEGGGLGAGQWGKFSFPLPRTLSIIAIFPPTLITSQSSPFFSQNTRFTKNAFRCEGTFPSPPPFPLLYFPFFSPSPFFPGFPAIPAFFCSVIIIE